VSNLLAEDWKEWAAMLQTKEFFTYVKDIANESLSEEIFPTDSFDLTRAYYKKVGRKQIEEDIDNFIAIKKIDKKKE